MTRVNGSISTFGKLEASGDTPISSLTVGVRPCKALMSIGEFIASLAANFIVAGVVWQLKGVNAGLICLAIGFVLLIVAYFLRKKPAPHVPPSQQNTQTVSQHFSPQFNPNIHIGYPSAPKADGPDDDAIAVLGFMGRVRSARYHEIEKIATGTNLTIQRTWNVLAQLEKEGRVNRTSADQAFKGALWRLDELERLPVSAQPSPKPESTIKFIETKNMEASSLDGCFHQASPGDVRISLACFRNEITTGQTAIAEPEPSLRAHVIYRDSDGHEITDVPMGVWLDQTSDIAKFSFGHKRCLILLLFNPRTKKRMKLWNELQHTSFGTFPQICDEELPCTIASIEVKLIGVYQRTCPVHMLLVAENLEGELPTFKVRPISPTED